MKIQSLLATLSVSIAFITSYAQAEVSPAPVKIACTAKALDASSPDKELLIIEAVDGTDLRENPAQTALHSAGVIQLRVNGAAEPTTFTYKTTIGILAEYITYTYRNPVFVSDITLLIKTRSGSDATVTGSWILDYPTAHVLDCRFLETDTNHSPALGRESDSTH